MSETYEFVKTPQYAGHWQIGGSTGLGIYAARRPRWLTRRLLRWLLEWEWIDSPSSGVGSSGD